MNVLTRGIRNAFRNSIRTGSLVLILGLTIGLSLSMLVARQAVSDKIHSVKASTGTTITVSPAGLRGFEGGGDALTGKDLDAIATLDHVKSISSSLQDRLDSDSTSLQSAIDVGSLGQRFSENNGQSFRMEVPPLGVRGGAGEAQITRVYTPPVTLVGTTSPTALNSQQGGGTLKLTSGKTIDGSSSDLVALVGSSLAHKNNLQTGSTFTAYGQTVTVQGIFDAGNDFANNQIIMPLAAVQTVSGQSDSITSVTVTADSISNIDSLTSAIRGKLGDKADVTNTAEHAQEVIAPLENIRTVTLYSLGGSVVAGSVIIFLAMVMIVRERRREIGVLKAIGAPNRTVMAQLMAEAATLTGLGALVGISLGAVASNPITKMLVNNSAEPITEVSMGGPGPRFAGRALDTMQDNLTTISATVGWDIIAYGLLAALTIAIIGSAAASFLIANVRPAEVMRTE